MRFVNVYRPNMLVDVMKEPKNEYSDIEGTFKLVKLLDTSDTFYLDYEKMSMSDKLTSTLIRNNKNSIEIKLNKLHELLTLYFSSENKEVKALLKLLRENCKPNLQSYYKLHIILASKQAEYCDRPHHYINNILANIDHEHVVRFIQQETIPEWKPNLYVLEKWSVESIPQNNFDIKYTTSRWLIKLYEVCAGSDKSLSRYTTYNGVIPNSSNDDDE